MSESDMLLLAKAIEQIPGPEGWWTSSGYETYLRIAKRLLDGGLPFPEVVGFLTDFYHAAAEQFGN